MKTDVSAGFNVLGYFDNNVKSSESMPKYLGTLQELPTFCNQDNSRIDEIYYTLPITTGQNFTPLVRFARMNMINFFVVPDFSRILKRKIDLLFLDNIPLFKFSTEPLAIKRNRVIKRVLDIIFSICVIILTYPFLFLIIAPIIKLTSKGPILFKQERTGLKGEDFICYKFRSMAVNKDADKKQATKGDARITKIGAFMRKTSLDEMPQFINVIKGDMSVVGPRPHMTKHTEEYSQLIDKYMFRHMVKPGITGWAQVTGFRGETKDLKQMEGRVERDVWYIENWSVLLDIKIILNTVINAIVGEDNAY
jgi:putative colanic acid biosynthesis UDP-glucose lipid carrier transferase